jgi:hypothetical protein
MISDLEPSELMDVLEQATAKLLAGQDLLEPDAEWTALVTGILDLPITYFRAVQIALAQGRWRKAKHPKSYIQKVARREAQKMGAARDPKSTLEIPQNVLDEDGQPLSYEGYLDYRSYDDGPVKQGGVWQARNASEEPIFVDEEGREIPMVNGRPVPEDLLMPEDDGPDAKLVVNFSKVAEGVGLDQDAAQVLKYRTAGVTREVLLNQIAKDDEERRKWQAAWQRVHERRDKIRALFDGPKKN